MRRFAIKFPGGHRGRVPPVPIPNTEVKPATADGTARETVWESRSLPALFVKPASFGSRAFFVDGVSPGVGQSLPHGYNKIKIRIKIKIKTGIRTG